MRGGREGEASERESRVRGESKNSGAGELYERGGDGEDGWKTKGNTKTGVRCGRAERRKLYQVKYKENTKTRRCRWGAVKVGVEERESRNVAGLYEVKHESITKMKRWRPEAVKVISGKERENRNVEKLNEVNMKEVQI